MNLRSNRRTALVLMALALLLVGFFFSKIAKRVTTQVRNSQHKSLCLDFMQREIPSFAQTAGLPFRGWEHELFGPEYWVKGTWESPAGSRHVITCTFEYEQDSDEPMLTFFNYDAICDYDDLDCRDLWISDGLPNIEKGPDGKFIRNPYPWRR